MKPKTFKSLREEGLYDLLLKTIIELEHLGYACVVWKPDELKGVDPAKLINATIEHGWEYIATFTEEPDPYDPDDTTINHPHLGTIIQRTPSDQQDTTNYPDTSKAILRVFQSPPHPQPTGHLLPMTPHPIKLDASQTYLVSIDPLTPAQALGVPEDGPTMSLIHQWIETKVSEATKDMKSDFKDALENFDYVELADNIEVSDIADRIGASRIAEEIDHSELASHIDVKDVASHMEASDIASEIDLENLAQHINATDVANNMDASAVAAEINLSELAQQINYLSLARAIGTLMGWDCKKGNTNA